MPTSSSPLPARGRSRRQAYGLGQVALALAVCVAGFAALGALALLGVSVDSFDLLGRGENPIHAQHPGDPRVTVPALFSGLLCVLAAGLAFAQRGGAEQRGVVAVVILLTLLAVIEVTMLQERVVSATSWPPLAIALALALPAVAAGLIGGGWRSLRGTTRSTLASAGAVWLIAAVVQGLSGSGDLLAPAAAELLEMVAAVLFVMGFLAAREKGGDERSDVVDEVADAVVGIDARRAAVAIAGCILVVGLLGVAVRQGASGVAAFDVNAERSVPTLFSGLLLFAAAGLAALSAVVAPPDRHHRAWWWALAAAFAFLGFDEVAAAHERLQFWTGTFGQLSLVPVLAVGALAGLITMSRFRRHRLGQVLLVVGAAAWLAAQVIDAAQSGGRLDALSVPEEMLEMAGSACFGFALLTALQAGVRRPPTATRDGASAVRPAGTPVADL